MNVKYISTEPIAFTYNGKRQTLSEGDEADLGQQTINKLGQHRFKEIEGDEE